MRLKINQIIFPFIMTILIMIVLEIFVTTMMPIIGLEHYRLPFNILIILYLGFKLETPFISILVLIIQLFYSIFSVEGWALGAFSGTIICMIISFLRDMLHFNSRLFTMLITQIFQIIWFLLVSFLIYLRVGNWDYIIMKLERFLPESITISIFALFFFAIFDRIWRIHDGNVLGEEM